MRKMFRFRKSNGGVSYVGVDNERKIYSTDYFANVGILNCDEPKNVRLKDIKAIISDCVDKGYKEVTYLKEENK